MKRALAVALITLAGCSADVGTCDPDEARRVVYDQNGQPAFVGQALMIASCGGGGLCHSEGARGLSRRGVPLGLDYDLRLASTTSATEPERTERLRQMQARAFEDRHAIWSAVSSLYMPIRGEASDEAYAAAPTYEHRELRTGLRRPMATLGDEAGREALRNWLACDLPVVERTEPASDGAEPIEPVGYIVSTQEEPLEPRWDDIYPRYIARCASAPCHDAVRPAVGLDLSTSEVALSSLLAQSAAEGADDLCAGEGRLLEPRAPERSLLFHKLRGTDEAGDRVCGERMPQSGGSISTASLEAIREWIAEGANP